MRMQGVCWHGRAHAPSYPPTRSDPSSNHVVVIGAGPTGLLAALYLGRRGYRVDVYERAPAPAVLSGPGAVLRGHNYPIVLSSRALLAFRELGLQTRCVCVCVCVLSACECAACTLRPTGEPPHSRLCATSDLVSWQCDHHRLHAYARSHCRAGCTLTLWWWPSLCPPPSFPLR
jgi:2-polyprenyl-6-methoxyphenol hydroxylase-like FAD-dependent oxidoreductase